MLELGDISDRLTREGWGEAGKRLSVFMGELRRDSVPIPDRFSGSLTKEKEEWKVWKTIEVGGINPKRLESMLVKDGVHITETALDMMRSEDFITLDQPEEIQLALVTPRRVGFKTLPTREEFYKRVLNRGLALCPPEAGPELRHNYLDQKADEWIFIGMEPIISSDGRPDVFRLHHGGDAPWLCSTWTFPGSQWDLDNKIVFRLCK